MDANLGKLLDAVDQLGHRLFNLKDDSGEQQDLAAGHPAVVSRMDAVIADFLRDSGAVLPMPNPAFGQPSARPNPEPRG